MKKITSILLVILMFCAAVVILSCKKNGQSGTSDVHENNVARGDISAQTWEKSQNDTSVSNIINQSEWPCFHGINRQNKSNDTGLMNDPIA